MSPLSQATAPTLHHAQCTRASTGAGSAGTCRGCYQPTMVMGRACTRTHPPPAAQPRQATSRRGLPMRKQCLLLSPSLSTEAPGPRSSGTLGPTVTTAARAKALRRMQVLFRCPRMSQVRTRAAPSCLVPQTACTLMHRRKAQQGTRLGKASPKQPSTLLALVQQLHPRPMWKCLPTWCQAPAGPLRLSSRPQPQPQPQHRLPRAVDGLLPQQASYPAAKSHRVSGRQEFGRDALQRLVPADNSRGGSKHTWCSAKHINCLLHATGTQF